MIGFIRGILEAKYSGKILVDVNGFGINILIADSTLEYLPSVGDEVKLFTYMNVKEDGVSLYGFITEEEQRLFNQLISVNGLGPKGAISMLGTYSASEIKYLIITSDSTKLSKAPTIGKKTAERIIIDLKDKISEEDILPVSVSSNDNKLSSEARDAIDALVSLGYDKKQAEGAVSKIDHVDELDANQILKLALKYLF